jgi:NitT/TauT family transport system substrate-binding protein
MKTNTKHASKTIVLLALAMAWTTPAVAAQIRLGDAGTMSIEKLVEAIAMEHAKKRGVDYVRKSLKSDDIAKQAFLSKDVDIVFGSNAYQLVQKLKVPAKHFFQLRLLAYMPVVNKSDYASWKDLNGKDFVVHARGSGTEVLAHQMETSHKIKFRKVSFVPGSQVRANALLRGTIKATYLNIPAVQYLMGKAPGKFMILPAGSQSASDSALFARSDFLEKNKDKVRIIVEELLKVIRKTNADPGYIARERKRLGLMKRLSKDREAGITPFYKVAAESQIYPNNGGGVAQAKGDFMFYTASGDLKGEPKSLKVGDYWDLRPLNAALTKLGRK